MTSSYQFALWKQECFLVPSLFFRILLNPAEESEYQREAQVQIIRNVWNYLTTALGFIEINESAKATERIEAALKDIDKLAPYYRR